MISPCWSLLDFWKIKLEKTSLTNWIFSEIKYRSTGGILDYKMACALSCIVASEATLRSLRGMNFENFQFLTKGVPLNLLRFTSHQKNWDRRLLFILQNFNFWIIKLTTTTSKTICRLENGGSHSRVFFPRARRKAELVSNHRG